MKSQNQNKHKRNKTATTDKPYVSQEYRDMRMTIKLDPKNKLSSILNNDIEDENDCEIDTN